MVNTSRIDVLTVARSGNFETDILDEIGNSWIVINPSTETPSAIACFRLESSRDYTRGVLICNVL